MKDLVGLTITLAAIVIVLGIAAWVTVEGYWWFGVLLVFAISTLRVRMDDKMETQKTQLIRMATIAKLQEEINKLCAVARIDIITCLGKSQNLDMECVSDWLVTYTPRKVK